MYRLFVNRFYDNLCSSQIMIFTSMTKVPSELIQKPLFDVAEALSQFVLGEPFHFGQPVLPFMLCLGRTRRADYIVWEELGEPTA